MSKIISTYSPYILILCLKYILLIYILLCDMETEEKTWNSSETLYIYFKAM